MFEAGKEDIVKYCLLSMLTTDQLLEASVSMGYSGPKSGSKATLIEKIAADQKSVVTLDRLRAFCIERWAAPPVAVHLDNLKGGKLSGHGWFEAMPSNLHLSLQNRARRIGQDGFTLEDFLAVAGGIAKHEYYIVAVADLCEDLIVRRFAGIPPLITRGVSDFILNEIPYDLKNTKVPDDSSIDLVAANPAAFVLKMLEGADTERLRKQAKDSLNNWANNRFYIVVENEAVWERDPEGALAKLAESLKTLGPPIKVDVGGVAIFSQVIVIPA